MKKTNWEKRFKNRTDISSKLVHLTKRTDSLTALEVLFSIIDSKLLKGSTGNGFIRKNKKAVCFQNIPYDNICKNVVYEFQYENESLQKKHDYELKISNSFNSEEFYSNNPLRIRYELVGLAFDADLLFKLGARPVIYSLKEELNQLPDSFQWRTVPLDLSLEDNYQDWSHEREWRIENDFNFSLSDATVILRDLEMKTEFDKYYKKRNPEILNEIKEIVIMCKFRLNCM